MYIFDYLINYSFYGNKFVILIEIFKMYFLDVWDNMRYRCNLDLEIVYIIRKYIFFKYNLKSM